MTVNILIYCGLNVSPCNSYVEVLMPKVMVLGSGVFGRCLGYQGGAFMNEISALVKEAWELPSHFPTMWWYNIRKICDQEEGLHLTILAPLSWSSSL